MTKCRGCERCGFRGTSGRCAVYELLPITRALQEVLYRAGESGSAPGFSALTAAVRSSGYQAYSLSVREKLLRGEVSPYWALRSVGVDPGLVGEDRDKR